MVSFRVPWSLACLVQGGKCDYPNAMKDPLLLVVLVIVGLFLYYIVTKGAVYLFFFPLIVASTFIWWFCNYYLTEKMVRKVRGEEKFFFYKAQYLDKRGELINGALVVTPTEITFYKRKGYRGGVAIVWSCFSSQIESYVTGDVDEAHKGLKLSLRKEKKPVIFVAKNFREQEKAFREALGWPEDEEN